MQAQFVNHARHIGAQSGLIAGKHTFDQSVKLKLRKCITIRLQSYPTVIIEYIGLFPVTVYDLYQLLAKIHDETVDECHPVFLTLFRRHMRHMQLALMDKVLRCHPIAVCLLELVQRQRTYRKIIGAPIRITVLPPRVASPDPDKIVKQ